MSTSTRQKKKDYKLNEASASTQHRQPIMLSTSKGLVRLKAFLILPDPFVRGQYLDLTYSELMVMLYVFHRTLGYRDPNNGGRKTSDAISHSQFLKGITTLTGKQLDKGAGVSERSLNRALDGLEEKGFIKRHYRTDRHGRQLTTIYELDLERAGAEWVQEDTAEEEATTNPLSDYLVDPKVGRTSSGAYKTATRRATDSNSNSTATKTVSAEAHFDEVAQSTQTQLAVSPAQVSNEETVKPAVEGTLINAAAMSGSSANGLHWHQEDSLAATTGHQEQPTHKEETGAATNSYVNQGEQKISYQQAVTTDISAKLRGLPLQNCGGYPCKTAGATPAKLRGTTEYFYKKESYKKDNKTQLLCDAGVGKLVSKTYQEANSFDQEQPELCVSFTGKSFPDLADNSNQASVMFSYPAKQSVTACKPQEASDHITTSQPAHNASDVAKNQPLAANFEPVRLSKLSEPDLAEQEQKAALAEEFCQAGVFQLEAYHLAAIAYANGHRAGSYVSECLRYIQRQGGVRNRPGLLTHLVRSNWQPPTREQKRFGSGLFANNHALASKWAHLNNRASVPYQEKQVGSSTLPADINPKCESQPWNDGVAEQISAAQERVTPEPFEMSPTPDQCREAWLRVCQRAVAEWDVGPELLVGSWLIPAASESRYLLLHLPEPSRLAAIRYKFSNLVRRELELDPSWQVVEEQQYSHFAVAS